MFTKFKEWLFPQKIKYSELPEHCQVRFFMINAAYAIGLISAVILSIVKLSWVFAILIPVFTIVYLAIYFIKIRPFFNNDVTIIEGEIVKTPDIKISSTNNKIFQIPRRHFLIIKTADDDLCEIPVESNYEGTKGEVVAVYANPNAVFKLQDKHYRISDYYFITTKSY